MSVPLQIFIAYARKDTSFLDELRTHFTPLQRSGKVKIWYDGKIEPGKVWEAAIKENLHSADIILMLISADAIASDYFYDKEMSDALARHAAGTARVVPLIVRPCAWQETPLGELQALPRDGKPVSTWPDRDDAYANAVTSLLATLNSIRMERAAAAEQAERERNQSEETTRRQREAATAAALEAERRKKEQAQQAENQRQQEEKHKREAAAAEQRRQKAEADRQEKAEQERQRKAAAAQKREQQMATLGSGLRSPKVWGSGLAGVFALLIGSWLCNKEPNIPQTNMNEGKDSTTLTENTPVNADTQAIGVKTISPELLPKDVTVEQPKKNQPEKPKPDPPKSATEEQKPKARRSGLEMVFVKGGTFTMGDAKGESDECPHEVTVGSFSIGKYEVTQADWKTVMGKNPSNFKCDQCPVEQVSWNDIQDFLKKANAKYGKAYRLPTEAEWEYAARGGSRSNGYTYSGSNSPGSVAWYGGNSGNKTHPVGEKADNELGLHDMSGNVWEWCQDVYKAYPGCKVSSSCENCRVLRGGSWFYVATWLRPADRGWYYPVFRYNFIGFRVAQD